MAQNSSGARSVPASPSVAKPIGATGLRGQVTGVTRFGAKAGIIVAGVLAVIVLAIVYGISNSGSHRAAVLICPSEELQGLADRRRIRGLLVD